MHVARVRHVHVVHENDFRKVHAPRVGAHALNLRGLVLVLGLGIGLVDVVAFTAEE